jgi:hypothetical protein
MVRPTRRLISAILGGLLFSGTAIECYFGTSEFYLEHYTWPKQKYGVLTPLRWQDTLFIVVFWCSAVMLFYLSYRLLKFAFRGEHGVTG